MRCGEIPTLGQSSDFNSIPNNLANSTLSIAAQNHAMRYAEASSAPTEKPIPTIMPDTIQRILATQRAGK
jgi:hypothetical protein